jgi:hypothetical protein
VQEEDRREGDPALKIAALIRMLWGGKQLPHILLIGGPQVLGLHHKQRIPAGKAVAFSAFGNAASIIETSKSHDKIGLCQQCI